MSATKGRVRVLILGGGDGLAAREVFRHGERIASLTLVDLDPAVTDLFKEHPLLRRLSGGSLEDRRLRVVNDDAMRFVQEDPGLYEVILVDLPDPDSPDLARLYTPAFYGLLFRRLAPGGVVATQATSAGLTPRAFWCVVRTLEETAKKARSPSPEVRPYHAYVPSFGDWGFVMVGPKGARPAAERLPQGLRYLDAPVMDGLFVFPPDMGRPEVEVNHLHDPVVIGYYRGDYDKTAY